MNKEFKSDQYDQIYATGGAEKIYDLPYRHSGYLPLFEVVFESLTSKPCRSVLEVGCGTGAFAHLLHDRAPTIRYRGFDFSPVAVERAAARFGAREAFFVGDARVETSYSPPSEAIVCTEVLEHIEADLEVVSKWPIGTRCVCSVPNFDADNHVRHFQTEDQVVQRYGTLIDIENVARVKKPFLSDLSPRNKLRALWWNRYRPRRLLAIMNLASFDELGGWFVFSGVRRK